MNRDQFAAQWEAEKAAALPIPAFPGRVEITGRILSTKTVTGFRGEPVEKMLVKHADGWKVWGTIPASIGTGDLRGRDITFTAKIEVSKDDPKFGFFSRPTRAKLVG